MRKFKVGIIGCGAIGTALAKVLIKDKKLNFRAVLTAVADKNPEQAEKLYRRIRRRLPLVSIREIVKRCDFVIEAAHPSISPAVASLALRHDKYVLIMSAGGLLNFPFKRLRALL
ncbi:MAG TPA: NAD(P)-binding domain-containing protein, partial [Candidatus Omnitrophota bacterium]|nr:NAD(P)-binding domain-containing protein [Candidatus Omnitrophota bacterium]